jgi:hypothetical protein
VYSIIIALEAVAMVIPPILPTAILIGLNVSGASLIQSSLLCTESSRPVLRLKAFGINSFQVNRVAVIGGCAVMCFDKTGTITENGLEFSGIRALVNNWSAFSHSSRSCSCFGPCLRSDIFSSNENAAIGDAIFDLAVRCQLMRCRYGCLSLAHETRPPHSGTRQPRILIPLAVKTLPTAVVLQGNEVDVKMFGASGFSFSSSCDTSSNNDFVCGNTLQLLSPSGTTFSVNGIDLVFRNSRAALAQIRSRIT